MTTTIYFALIALYYLVVFTGFLTLFIIFATVIIYSLNKLALKYKFLWMIAEYKYYRKDFKKFFKDKRSVTGRFNNK